MKTAVVSIFFLILVTMEKQSIRYTGCVAVPIVEVKILLIN
jgi:hypothetical protein